MAVALVSNSYLDDTSNKIRAKPVPWEGYQRADLVTAEELALIKRVDRQSRAKTEAVLLSEGPAYALLYLSLLKKLQRIDTMQCLLVLIADALSEHEERIPLFTRTQQTDPDLPYSPLLSAPSTALPLRQLQPFINTLSALIKSPSTNKRDVGVQCLESLLARPEFRQIVWETPGLVQALVDALKNNPGPQMSYQVGFCIWLLSFETNIAEEINKKYDIIAELITVAQTAVKEKVIRVIVATFRNLIVKAPAANLPAMLVCQLLPFSKNLVARKWTDEDIVEDVKFLKEELTNRFQSLTTWDEYTSELASGHLSWTPVHQSDEFWKENATKLNEKGHEQLKVLINLLKESNDPVVLAVACHDIGQYVKYYERGKKIVNDLGGKNRVMSLMTHKDPDVRYRALLSVQQLVSQPWISA
ncbi:MSTP042 [Coprinopsis cinerea okayama7|uniref:MSTP042 n=1 Tax=Coprinopsis cinerea (strain Okayama-7 / 130 / ATCC MYA-4618 / FGSC 9003) TaxID=240176 RepID=A8NG45_COPC7|nr:MSTP042 [Coprinopsis cinerea okayama7\|eukprot:XP_001833472.1 MSTP042 [Coprinopsis cinerea okayama7\